MIRRVNIGLWVVMMLASAISPSCQTKKVAETSRVQSLMGVLYVTGNEPFTQLSLQTADGVMHPINRDSTMVYTDLWKLQGRKVEVFCRPLLRKSVPPSLIIERYHVVE